jgi:hypothetical protein
VGWLAARWVGVRRHHSAASAFGWFGTSKATVILRLPHFGHRKSAGGLSKDIASPRAHTSVFISNPVDVSHQTALRLLGRKVP